MGHRYVVLGAGRQGVAAAYDLARFGDADHIVLADADLGAAQKGAERVNDLAEREIVHPVALDVRDVSAVRRELDGALVCLSAVPYQFNLDLTQVAIAARCSFCDLGGNTEVVMNQLGLNGEARSADVTVVPDCGVGPGLISNLAVYGMEQLDAADEVLIYDGGLPQEPRPPFNYTIGFNVGGLTNEYYGEALYLEDGAVKPVRTFDEAEYELVQIPQMGELEAFVTSGGLSTLVRTYAGRLSRLKNKTLRYPGHYALFKGMLDLGLLEEEPIIVDGVPVRPRQVLHELLSARLSPSLSDRDLVVIHIVIRGLKDQKPATITVDLLDRYDEVTGFAAMERTTGFHLAIVAAMMARKEIAPGAIPLEQAVDSTRIVQALQPRGMHPQTRVVV